MDEREISAGQVRVTSLRDGWYLVEIGRSRKVKRIYLADNEARQLIDALRGLMVEIGSDR